MPSMTILKGVLTTLTSVPIMTDNVIVTLFKQDNTTDEKYVVIGYKEISHPKLRDIFNYILDHPETTHYHIYDKYSSADTERLLSELKERLEKK